MRSLKYQGNLTHFKKQEFTAAQALVIFEVAEVFVSSTRSSASDTLPPYVSPSGLMKKPVKSHGQLCHDQPCFGLSVTLYIKKELLKTYKVVMLM